METFIIGIIEKVGYLGVFILIFLENIFPPIPSEVILLFSGFMTTFSDLKLIFIILYSSFASYLGALFLYFIGRIINKDKLKSIFNGKLGKIVHLKDTDIDNASLWFEKKGAITVFICRFLPLVRSLISIPAGMNKMNIYKFSFFTILGSLIWNCLFIIIGVIFGDNWIYIARVMDRYSFIVLISLFVLGLIGVYVLFKKKRKKV